ncbi:hypothetical protein BaRGS_00008067 [Batillaria attramentaria]|uniref:MRH domain-containing protein n=1 Tax=Batillaria attramentaria TaxID=370345 RepID=A0ABD0LP88_9CAEN
MATKTAAAQAAPNTTTTATSANVTETNTNWMRIFNLINPKETFPLENSDQVKSNQTVTTHAPINTQHNVTTPRKWRWFFSQVPKTRPDFNPAFVNPKQIFPIENSRDRFQFGHPVTKHAPTNRPKAGEQGIGGCRKLNPCRCEADDGSYVDLTPIANKDKTPRFRDVPDFTGQYSYSWNPCFGFNEGSCNDVGWVPDASPAYYNLGNQTSVDFEVSSERGLTMKYIGDGGLYVAFRQSYVQLVCDQDVEADFKAEGEPEPLSGVYYFTLRSRYACPVGGRNVTTRPPPVTTPPTPGVITVTSGPGPTPDPVYNLKTVVDLLFCLLITAAVGVVVLLLLLVAIIVKRNTLTSLESAPDTAREKWPLP